MITNEAYQNALKIVKLYRQQCIDAIGEIDKNIDKNFEIRNTKLTDTLVTDLSVRTLNVLFYNYSNLNQFDSTVKDLANISRSDLFSCRNMGRKSMKEIDELCQRANILMRP